MREGFSKRGLPGPDRLKQSHAERETREKKTPTFVPENYRMGREAAEPGRRGHLGGSDYPKGGEDESSFIPAEQLSPEHVSGFVSSEEERLEQSAEEETRTSEEEEREQTLKKIEGWEQEDKDRRAGSIAGDAGKYRKVPNPIVTKATKAEQDSNRRRQRGMRPDEAIKVWRRPPEEEAKKAA